MATTNSTAYTWFASSLVTLLRRLLSFPNQRFYPAKLLKWQDAVAATVVTGNGNIFRLCPIPGGYYAGDVTVTMPTMDSNASKTTVYDLVTLDSAGSVVNTLISASTTAKAGGTDAIAASAKFLYVGNQTLALRFSTGSATPVAGTWTLNMLLHDGAVIPSRDPYSVANPGY
jgi:hypothetical protein